MSAIVSFFCKCRQYLYIITVTALISSKSEILYFEAMNGSIPANWTITGTFQAVTDPNCPGTYTDCWQGTNTATLTLSTRIDTSSHKNISLEYSIAATALNGQDECILSYTTAATATYTPLTSIRAADTAQDRTQQIATIPSASLNANGLSFQLESSGASLQCYYAFFTVQGEPTTPSPTQSPTNNPSGSPTTAIPSVSPTNVPTQTPTKTPTGSPTTAQPTVPPGTPTTSPTLEPTVEPTLSPTQEPIAPGSPTRAPTDAPVTPSVTTSTETVSTTQDDEGDDNNDQGLLQSGVGLVTDYLLYVLIGAGVVLLCCVLLIWMMCRKKKSKQQKTVKNMESEVKQAKYEETAPQSPISTGGTGDVEMGATDLMDTEVDTKDKIDPYAAAKTGAPKYDTERIQTNTDRTNKLPENFWEEESDSENPDHVMRKWKKNKSEVADVDEDEDDNEDIYGKRKSVKAERETKTTAPPPPSSPPPPETKPEQPAAPDLAQIFGRSNNQADDATDSDEDSLMKKQRQFGSEDDEDGEDQELP